MPALFTGVKQDAAEVYRTLLQPLLLQSYFENGSKFFHLLVFLMQVKIRT